MRLQRRLEERRHGRVVRQQTARPLGPGQRPGLALRAGRALVRRRHRLGLGHLAPAAAGRPRALPPAPGRRRPARAPRAVGELAQGARPPEPDRPGTAPGPPGRSAPRPPPCAAGQRQACARTSAACRRHASSRPWRDSSQHSPAERHHLLGRLTRLLGEAHHRRVVGLGLRPRRGRGLVTGQVPQHGGQRPDPRLLTCRCHQVPDGQATTRGVTQVQRDQHRQRQPMTGPRRGRGSPAAEGRPPGGHRLLPGARRGCALSRSRPDRGPGPGRRSRRGPARPSRCASATAALASAR